jgi:hypothetical protein
MEEPYQIKKISIPINEAQNTIMKVHACPQGDSGIFIYLFTKDESKIGSTTFITVFLINMGRLS